MSRQSRCSSSHIANYISKIIDSSELEHPNNYKPEEDSTTLSLCMAASQSSTGSGATPIRCAGCAPDKKEGAMSMKEIDPKVLAIQVQAWGLEPV
jgi:hypothetical protein